jgi:hypothetical protein
MEVDVRVFVRAESATIRAERRPPEPPVTPKSRAGRRVQFPLLEFLVGGSACESRAEVDVFRDLHGHKIKKANKWMLAMAGAALLVYSESSARRARSLSFAALRFHLITAVRFKLDRTVSGFTQHSSPVQATRHVLVVGSES